MKHKKYSMTITEEERTWFHELARAEKISIPLLIRQCFRKKSEQLGIALPENTIQDNKRHYNYNEHAVSNKELYVREIKEENFQINFL